MNDLSFCYVEYFPPHLKDSQYHLTESIMPSEEESLARIKRTEKDQKTECYTQDKDHQLVKDSKGYLTGKGVFHSVSLLERAKIEVARYTTMTNMMPEEATLTKEQQNALNASKNFMIKYRIPLDPTLREDLSHYIKPSTIENIKRMVSDDKHFDLMAGTSNTTARTLRALHDIGAIDSIDDAQVMANLCGAMLVIGGHHTFLEIIEPYNRLLVVLGIKALEKEDYVMAKQAQTEQFPLININRHMIPYFLHPSYRDNVIEKAKNISALSATLSARL